MFVNLLNFLRGKFRWCSGLLKIWYCNFPHIYFHSYSRSYLNIWNQVINLYFFGCFSLIILIIWRFLPHECAVWIQIFFQSGFCCHQILAALLSETFFGKRLDLSWQYLLSKNQCQKNVNHRFPCMYPHHYFHMHSRKNSNHPQNSNFK